MLSVPAWKAKAISQDPKQIRRPGELRPLVPSSLLLRRHATYRTRCAAAEPRSEPERAHRAASEPDHDEHQRHPARDTRTPGVTADRIAG